MTQLDPKLSWSSFQNIHQKFIKNNLDEYLGSRSLFSLKMDGSNLAIQCLLIDGVWTIRNLIGRNSILYDSENPKKSIDKLSYGKAFDLDVLPIGMLEFTKNIAKTLSKQLNLLNLPNLSNLPDYQIDDIIVYGEAFKINKNQKYASWHPFGYKLPKQNIMSMLNQSTYELFISNGLIFEDGEFKQFNTEFGVNYNELLQTIVSAAGHIICPPSLFFDGKVSDGICYLHQMMLTNTDQNFEGVFIVSNEPNGVLNGLNSEPIEITNTSFKWKTGKHEEQKKIPCISKIKEPTEFAIQIYSKLVEVYNTGISNSSSNSIEESVLVPVDTCLQDEKTRKIMEIRLIEELKIQLQISTDKILSKKESFESVSKPDRNKILLPFISEVISELISHYDDEQKVPWSIETIKKYANILIKPIIMKIEYKET